MCPLVSPHFVSNGMPLVLSYPKEDLVDWGRKWLVDFNGGTCLTGPITLVLFMDGSALEEKSSFKMLDLSFL